MAYDTDKFFGSEGNFFLSDYQQVSVVLLVLRMVFLYNVVEWCFCFCLQDYMQA